jgi:hypothetical protein
MFIKGSFSGGFARMKLHKPKMFLALSAILIAARVSQATPINGSLPLVGLNVTQNGSDLSISTIITATMTVTASIGTGDYSFISVGSNWGPSTLNYTSNATLSTFTFGNSVLGTFVAANDPANQVVQKTANFLDVFLIGTFIPGTAWPPGKDLTSSSLRFSINQSGASISEAITLNSPALPPPGVPEPETMALIVPAVVALMSYKRFAR